MSDLRIVIVEDEPVIARELSHVLQQLDPDIIIVQVLASVTDAVEWFKNNPDAYHLIMMDIRLSDGHSFDIFKQVAITKPVIFVTSYHDYAIEAFKSNGLDYILKPFDDAELNRALSKYHNWIKSETPSPQVNLNQLIAQISGLNKSYRKSFLVHVKNKLIPLETGQIAWFYTTNEMVYAQTLDNRRFVIEQTMEQLSQQLDPQHFVRANRQFILQRKAIAEIDFYFNGRLMLNVKPEPPERIVISKARVPEFKAWMNS